MFELFIVKFEDGTKFKGGNITNHKWLNVPDKPISAVSYRMPDGSYMTLEKYNKYCFFIEACKDLNGKFAGVLRPEFMYIITKAETLYYIKKINLNIKDGSYTERIATEEDSFIRQINPMYWKG